LGTKKQTTLEYALFELGENAQLFPYLSSSMGIEGLLINFSPPAQPTTQTHVFHIYGHGFCPTSPPTIEPSSNTEV
jgi:hypothetical protein